MLLATAPAGRVARSMKKKLLRTLPRVHGLTPSYLSLGREREGQNHVRHLTQDGHCILRLALPVEAMQQPDSLAEAPIPEQTGG
jgi:hypothetical protein